MRAWWLGLGVLLGCVDAAPGAADPLRPTLVWVRGYDGETWASARDGLWWGLSLLGASPPAGGGVIEVLEPGEARVRFSLDLRAAGFPHAALAPLEEALQDLGASDEAALFGGVDLGRFFMLTLYSPWRYYAIVGACPTLQDWQASRLDAEPAAFAVTDSLLVPGDREVLFNPDPAGQPELAFQASEGQGLLSDGTFAPAEYEVLDLMPNGQQRFAVYGLDGALLPAATQSPAGQPGRCHWCHEGHMQILSPGNEAVPGYLSPDQFQGQLDLAQAVIDATRAREPTAVDWARAGDVHAYAELLVETFLFPSVARLAREWGVEEEALQSKVESLGLALHESEEYPEFPPLLTRADIDRAMPMLLPWIDATTEINLGEIVYSGYEPLPSLASARELAEEDFGALEGRELAAEIDRCGD